VTARREIQVAPSHYTRGAYDTRERWMSYWQQAHEVLRSHPAEVLEVGVGNGTVAAYLRAAGVDLTTVDFDQALQPDVVADVRGLPFEEDSFDVVLCAEVLEHLPFDEVPLALAQLARVARRRAVISIPVFGRAFRLSVRIPPFAGRQWSWHLPARHSFSFDGQHYWEMGATNYRRRKVLSVFERYFMIERRYVAPENPYHYFVIGSPR
jgi:ubiquinone/menaquinone biosynthesis C-methylase UbiE